MQPRLNILKTKNKIDFNTTIPKVFLIIFLLKVYLIDNTSLSVNIVSIKIFFTKEAIIAENIMEIYEYDNFHLPLNIYILQIILSVINAVLKKIKKQKYKK